MVAIFAAIAVSAQHAAAASAGPYPRLPAAGDAVRLDGSVGEEKFAWAFYSDYWLQTYLRFTIEAARNPQVYSKSQAALGVIGSHALVIPNGTRGVVGGSDDLPVCGARRCPGQGDGAGRRPARQ